MSLLAAVRKAHSSLVVPISKDLVSFGIKNLYWTPRPHIAWSYISISGPFYICERLEAYGDEILRQLDDLPRLINEVNIKHKSLLAFRERPQIKDDLIKVTERLENVYRSSGAALSEILKTYHSLIETSLSDWAMNFKRILLYHQLLAIIKAKDADSSLVEDISRKNRKLTEEYLGGRQWTQGSKKYREIFTPLDITSYHLSNLKFELLDISLQLDNIFLLASTE